MEFLTVILIVGILGCMLGYFSAKKWKPGKVRRIEALLLSAVLGLSIYAALKVSKVYIVCVALLAGELIGIAAPRKNE